MVTDFERDNIIETLPEDEDLMLPEGYGADDDIFAEPSNDADKQADEFAETAEEEESKGDGAEEAPTTEQNDAQDVAGNENAETPTTESTAPTTEQVAANEGSNILKFRAKYNSQEMDVELNRDELPTVWQKARKLDSMQSHYNEQQKLIDKIENASRKIGYANAVEMADKIISAYEDAEVKNLMATENIPERIAKAVVAQEMAQRTPVHTEPAPAKRNPSAEVAELLAVKPELRGTQLPQEVLAAAQNGKNLLQAYTEYESKKAAQEAAKVQQQANIQKQNAANAAKAPVKGTAMGGAPKKETGEDDFLRGFNSDY